MRYSLLLLFLSCGLYGQAQFDTIGYSITCWGRDTVIEATVPGPANVIDGSAEMRTRFEVTFTDSVPPEAEESIRFAADVWGSYLQSDVPVRVLVDWRDQGDDRILASAGPSTIYRAFPGAVNPLVWYPVALAEAITGEDLNKTDEADINVVVNSKANWNYGTTGSVPRNRIDLASVVLHELGHGLGFLSSVDSTTDTTLSIGFEDPELNERLFIIYDLFLETPPGQQLADTLLFNSPSEELLAAVIERLEFAGDTSVALNGGELVPLYAPETFDVGSSVSHLDERTYRAGTEDALMTPSIASGEAIRSPGPVTLGVLYDLGWPLSFESVTSLHEVIADRLRIYPNPASGSFTLETEAIQEPTYALVFAADGRQVKRQPILLSGGQAQIDITGLTPGFYTVLVPAGRRAYSGRVVVR
ncbi:T9SS type A sorting domain-containing protein [Lewinella sp. IMCC34191]|uniref:T9SS type A sorting domain-containing protein n=1 Tax=Lewinella sp. IMCC34191 TaxID=2259172 RepID=UPI000E2395C2|nr:T9SS type A sorting domain-containing protein [Lewinella sp. IMCC34191]